jgi:hypothetical protein
LLSESSNLYSRSQEPVEEYIVQLFDIAQRINFGSHNVAEVPLGVHCELLLVLHTVYILEGRQTSICFAI